MTFRVAPPHTDDCQLCDLPLGDAQTVRVKRGRVHLTCLQAEQS